MLTCLLVALQPLMENTFLAARQVEYLVVSQECFTSEAKYLARSLQRPLARSGIVGGGGWI